MVAEGESHGLPTPRHTAKNTPFLTKKEELSDAAIPAGSSLFGRVLLCVGGDHPSHHQPDRVVVYYMQ